MGEKRGGMQAERATEDFDARVRRLRWWNIAVGLFLAVQPA